MSDDAIDNEARSDESDMATLELIAPFMEREVIIELCSGRRYEEYRRRKIAMHRARTYRAIWRQQMMAREMAQMQTGFIEGIGQRKMIVDPDLQAHVEAKYGRGCWKDDEFKRDTWKKTPEVRVPAPPRRFFPVNGFRDSRRPVVEAAGQPGDAGNGAQGEPATRDEVDVRHATPCADILPNNERNQ